jgi:hypothetical protein
VQWSRDGNELSLANISNREELKMAEGSGDIRQLYGVILRDKAKTADIETLMAYRLVATDMMHTASKEVAKELEEALVDVEKAIQAKW